MNRTRSVFSKREKDRQKRDIPDSLSGCGVPAGPPRASEVWTFQALLQSWQALAGCLVRWSSSRGVDVNRCRLIAAETANARVMSSAELR